LANGPAGAAGLKPGDRLVKFQGRSVYGLDGLQQFTRKGAPGDKIKVRGQRGKGKQKVELGFTAGEGLGHEEATPARAPGPGARPRGAGPGKLAKPVVVPFEVLKTGHMTVMVKVNGKGPYKLIFDTGAPINLLNNKVAREAGLLKGVPRPLFTVFGSMGDVKV